ncbi:hypothetical protein [Pasteurella sp. PK-2025]|uniref:hypothetical protein n=1 Tax=Pasteurella sp. PK-2025 TaxID=3413133 RepID=UPI003C76C426
MIYDIDMNVKYGDGYLSTKKDHNSYEIDPEYQNLCKAIEKSDILRVLNGYFLFSEKLKNVLSYDKTFKFKKVNIFFREQFLSNSYFLVSIENKIALIDYNNSIIVGNPFFDKLVFNLGNIKPNDLAIIDKDDEHYIYYTEKFYELVKSHQIDIDLLEVM